MTRAAWCVLLMLATVAAAAARANVAFLDAEAARAAIVDDSAEPYFDKLQPLEMAAKTGSPVPGATLEEQGAECRRRYQAAVREFTPEEKEALQWYVSNFQPALEKDYPLVARTPWSFLKVADNIEGGLPHTRGGHIILNARSVSGLAAARQAPAARAAGAESDLLYGAAVLLVHEQMHVVQRAHAGLFDGLYTDMWGFRRATVEDCPWVIQRQVVNPDAVDWGWVYPVEKEKGVRYIWPRVLLAERDGVPTMPQDFRMVAIAVEEADGGFRVRMGTEGRPLFRRLEEVGEYGAKLYPASDIYHPAEAAADMFAHVMAFDAFAPKGTMPKEVLEATEAACAPMRAWFREHLQAESDKLQVPSEDGRQS